MNKCIISRKRTRQITVSASAIVVFVNIIALAFIDFSALVTYANEIFLGATLVIIVPSAILGL